MAYLSDAPLDLAALLSEARSSDGGLCLFVGVVRDENAGRRTVAIEYDYPGRATLLTTALRRPAGENRIWSAIL